MSLAQSLARKKVDQSLVMDMARKLAHRIRQAVIPSRIILFGSAAEGRFKEGSDIDLMLVFANLEALKEGRKLIRAQGRLSDSVPVDLIFVTQEHYDAKKKLGGVCYVAEHEGIDL